MKLVLGVTTLDTGGITLTGVGVRDDPEEPVVVVGLRRWQELQRAEARLRELEVQKTQVLDLAMNRIFHLGPDTHRALRGK